jgi:hypothetical protein
VSGQKLARMEVPRQENIATNLLISFVWLILSGCIKVTQTCRPAFCAHQNFSFWLKDVWVTLAEI